MPAEIHEFRNMVVAGRRYLDGEASIQELNSYVKRCSDAATLFGEHPAITALAEEWWTMVGRRWNEWHSEPEPLSEAEFREWLQRAILDEKHPC
jgi:hypothetical protein